MVAQIGHGEQNYRIKSSNISNAEHFCMEMFDSYSRILRCGDKFYLVVKKQPREKNSIDSSSLDACAKGVDSPLIAVFVHIIQHCIIRVS